MPQLRITRDRRGYENTCLVHTFRHRGRTRSRVLYWFRTPPDVKVGRTAFDEEAIRGIEATHPDIAFDWDRILTERPPPERDRRERFERPRRARPTASIEQQPAPPADRPSDADRHIEEAHAAPAALNPARHPTPSTLDAAPCAEAPEPLADLTGDDGGVADTDADAGEPEADEPFEMAPGPTGLHPVDALIHVDRLRGLRIRYAELLARITQRIPEPERQAELRIQAERLNPDVWVTEDEARAGLAEYDRAYAALRATLGLRRRRRGGRGRNNKR